jgi:hypothetical protein
MFVNVLTNINFSINKNDEGAIESNLLHELYQCYVFI